MRVKKKQKNEVGDLKALDELLKRHVRTVDALDIVGGRAQRRVEVEARELVLPPAGSGCGHSFKLRLS